MKKFLAFSAVMMFLPAITVSAALLEGTVSKVDHVSSERCSEAVVVPIKSIRCVAMPRRRQGARTKTSHRMSRSSPAESDQHAAVATGVPSSVSTTQV